MNNLDRFRNQKVQGMKLTPSSLLELQLKHIKKHQTARATTTKQQLFSQDSSLICQKDRPFSLTPSSFYLIQQDDTQTVASLNAWCLFFKHIKMRDLKLWYDTLSLKIHLAIENAYLFNYNGNPYNSKKLAWFF